MGIRIKDHSYSSMIAINATIKLINNQKSKNQIFNVGSEKEISILNCAKQILKIIKIKRKLNYMTHPWEVQKEESQIFQKLKN